MTKKTRKPKSRKQNKFNWIYFVAAGAILLVIFTIFISSQNAAPSSSAKTGSYDEIWAAELSKHLDGNCNIAGPKAYQLDWMAGTGAIVEMGYNQDEACVLISQLHIGRENTPEQILALFKKEANTPDAMALMHEQLDWRQIINFVNPLGTYEVNVLGDFLAYRMLSAEDQEILWAMAPGNFGKEEWNKIIDCDILKEANDASTMKDMATIKGGIPGILSAMGC